MDREEYLLHKYLKAAVGTRDWYSGGAAGPPFFSPDRAQPAEIQPDRAEKVEPEPGPIGLGLSPV